MAQPASRADGARGYYENLTAAYLAYGGDRGWHFGVWDPGVRSHREALLRTSERLLEGFALDHTSRVLDVGCGMGDFARWCAREVGCTVTGISIVPSHVEQATALAEQEGLGDRCRFLVQDMNQLQLPEGSFDLVVNEESLCYVTDIGRYLAAVFRVLAPGGRWSAIALSRIPHIEDPVDVEQYETTLTGWHIHRLVPAGEIGARLADAGFIKRARADLTRRVVPSAQILIAESRTVLDLGSVGLDWLAFPRSGDYADYRGHFAAADAYSRGLLSGWARHMQYRALKPPIST